MRKKIFMSGFRNAIFILTLLVTSLLFTTLHSETKGSYKFTSDVSYYYYTSHEGKFVANTDFLYRENLENLPYSLGKWNGEDIPVSDDNILHLRSYDNQETGQRLYLITVHGTNESLFHTSEVCYIGDGWKIQERKYKEIEIRGEKFHARYAIAEKNGVQHMILYWFLWGDSSRRITDGMTMLRFSVEIDESIEASENGILDFIHELAYLDFEIPGRDHAEEAFPKYTLPIQKSKSVPIEEFSQIYNKASQWLKEQIVPNRIVPEPAQSRRNLLISYRVPRDSEDYRYVFSKASIYDNALAIIAFSMNREFSLAERIIEAASRVMNDDGDLWFTFNTHNSWPNENDHYGAISRSGASAWFGYAILFYLRAKMLDEDSSLQNSKTANHFLRLAKKIGNLILSRQILHKTDKRFGFITGGEGLYKYRKNDETKDVEEVFIPHTIAWASVEHNIDTFFFLRDLGAITGEKKYQDAASLLKESIVKKAWNDDIGQFNRGQREDGGDAIEALDCASWGAMFLASINEKAKASLALKNTQKFVSKSTSYYAYKPYVNMLIYEGRHINSLLYPEKPSKNWNESNMVWPEGSLGVAMAYLKLSNVKASKEIVKEIAKMMDKEGGIPYASENIRFQFSENASVASNAWLLMVLSALENESMKELFWGP